MGSCCFLNANAMSLLAQAARPPRGKRVTQRQFRVMRQGNGQAFEGLAHLGPGVQSRLIVHCTIFKRPAVAADKNA
uniref:Uncharacterized protein n=1 Tax=Ralstonia syzygii R24 TaxID=907261 RepID=G3A7C4_9RALS|nr:exported hypothetical protein [Ralstonia syzygii R24]